VVFGVVTGLVTGWVARRRCPRPELALTRDQQRYAVCTTMSDTGTTVCTSNVRAVGKSLMRVCMFCGDSPVTREHIWPNWLNLILAPKFDSYRQISTRKYPNESTQERSHSTTKNSATTKIACAKCNNAWMATMEGSVKTLLAPIISQQIPTALSLEQQLLISAWVTKTAMVLDNLFDGPDCFTQSERDAMRAQQVSPSHARIQMGALNSSAIEMGPIRYIRMQGHVSPIATSGDRADGFVIGIAVGPLLFCYLSSPDRSSASLTDTGRTFPRWFEILPPSRAVSWPLVESLNAESSLELITEKLPRGSVQMSKTDIVRLWDPDSR